MIIWNRKWNYFDPWWDGHSPVDDFRLWNFVKSSFTGKDIDIIGLLDLTGNRNIFNRKWNYFDLLMRWPLPSRWFSALEFCQKLNSSQRYWWSMLPLKGVMGCKWYLWWFLKVWVINGVGNNRCGSLKVWVINGVGNKWYGKSILLVINGVGNKRCG